MLPLWKLELQELGSRDNDLALLQPHGEKLQVLAKLFQHGIIDHARLVEDPCKSFSGQECLHIVMVGHTSNVPLPLVTVSKLDLHECIDLVSGIEQAGMTSDPLLGIRIKSKFLQLCLIPSKLFT